MAGCGAFAGPGEEEEELEEEAAQDEDAQLPRFPPLHRLGEPHEFSLWPYLPPLAPTRNQNSICRWFLLFEIVVRWPTDHV
jgi:hypothetical protein